MGYCHLILVHKVAGGQLMLLAAFQLVALVIALHHVKVQAGGRDGDVLSVCGVQGRTAGASEYPANIGDIMDQVEGLYLQVTAGLMAKHRGLSRLQNGDIVRADTRLTAQRNKKAAAADEPNAGAVFMDSPDGCGVKMVSMDMSQKDHTKLAQVFPELVKGYTAVDEVYAAQKDGVTPGPCGDDLTGH